MFGSGSIHGSSVCRNGEALDLQEVRKEMLQRKYAVVIRMSRRRDAFLGSGLLRSRW